MMLIRVVIKRLLGVLSLTIGLAMVAFIIYNVFHPIPGFKRNFYNVFQLGLPIVFIIFGWRWIRYEGPGIERTPADFKCRELVESVTRAKQSLPYFVKEVEKNVDGAYIKFPLLTPQGLTEHIWAYVHSFRDGKFNVSLANRPIDPKEPAEGRRDVPLADVEDWQIMLPDGRIKGAYSLIALFQHHENQGQKLSPKMKRQKAQLVDASQVASY